MKYVALKFGLLASLFTLVCLTCCGNRDRNVRPETLQVAVEIIPDTTLISRYLAADACLRSYQSQVLQLYQKQLRSFWFDKNRQPTDSALKLLSHCAAMADEGIFNSCLSEKHFSLLNSKTYSDEQEFLLTAIFFYYCDRVFKGLPTEDISSTGWFITRAERNFIKLAEDFSTNAAFLETDTLLIPQYYQLRSALKQYREMGKRGGWDALSLPAGETIRFGDTHLLIPKISRRLYREGYQVDTTGTSFNASLLSAVSRYQMTHNRVPDSTIGPALLKSLSIPVEQRIRSIALNMERCRWVAPQRSDEFIAVNIPAYELYYIRKSQPVLQSKVVVGKVITKTVVFNGQIDEIVFSPYWNVPNSILQKEILPAVKKSPGYFKRHNMEWHQGRVRQRPGKNNSLGLVKFMFPNSNNIYLHDTPQKDLFKRSERAFSHGCIRVEKARELAVEIMQKDYQWTSPQVDAAMQAGVEKAYRLKRKIPVYIAYFTALADATGTVSFYHDIYDRDEMLDSLLMQPR